MNAVLLERQLIEARIHADALNRTVEQLKALEASLRSEEIDRIIGRNIRDPSDTGRLLGLCLLKYFRREKGIELSFNVK